MSERNRAPRRRVVVARMLTERMPGGGVAPTDQWEYLLTCGHRTYGRAPTVYCCRRACRQCGEEGR